MSLPPLYHPPAPFFLPIPKLRHFCPHVPRPGVQIAGWWYGTALRDGGSCTTTTTTYIPMLFFYCIKVVVMWYLTIWTNRHMLSSSLHFLSAFGSSRLNLTPECIHGLAEICLGRVRSTGLQGSNNMLYRLSARGRKQAYPLLLWRRLPCETMLSFPFAILVIYSHFTQLYMNGTCVERCLVD